MTPSRESDVKSTARGNWKAVVKRNMKIPMRRDYIVGCVGRIIVYELRVLCSDKYSSILTNHGAEQITNFHWDHVIDEAKEAMPVLLKLLSMSMKTRTERDNANAIIGLIISILAKQRRPTSSLFQKIVSLILYSGHCSKKVYNLHVSYVMIIIIDF